MYDSIKNKQQQGWLCQQNIVTSKFESYSIPAQVTESPIINTRWTKFPERVNFFFSTMERWNGSFTTNPYLLKSAFGQAEIDKLDFKIGDANQDVDGYISNERYVYISYICLHFIYLFTFIRSHEKSKWMCGFSHVNLMEINFPMIAGLHQWQTQG